jgi:hypothetical protein
VKRVAYTPIRRLAKLRSGSGFPEALQGLQDEELPFLKVRNLGAPAGTPLEWDHSISRETARAINATPLRPPQILMAKIGLSCRFRGWVERA